jgi:hypothetical protein
MRHREALRKFVEWSAAGDAAEQAVPLQSEFHGDVELRWWPSWGRAGRLLWCFAGIKEDPEIDLTPDVQARHAEIRAQLAQWQKNEADWPLARKP